jgi:hypothetical protein
MANFLLRSYRIDILFGAAAGKVEDRYILANPTKL